MPPSSLEPGRIGYVRGTRRSSRREKKKKEEELRALEPARLLGGPFSSSSAAPTRRLLVHLRGAILELGLEVLSKKTTAKDGVRSARRTKTGLWSATATGRPLNTNSRKLDPIARQVARLLLILDLLLPLRPRLSPSRSARRSPSKSGNSPRLVPLCFFGRAANHHLHLYISQLLRAR